MAMATASSVVCTPKLPLSPLKVPRVPGAEA
jgi:hypothetical protein